MLFLVGPSVLQIKMQTGSTSELMLGTGHEGALGCGRRPPFLASLLPQDNDGLQVSGDGLAIPVDLELGKAGCELGTSQRLC